MRYILNIFIMFGYILSQTDTDNTLSKKIIYYTFNNELDKATALIDQQIENDPANPKYYLLKIAKDLRVINDSTQSIQPWEKRKHVRDSLLNLVLETNEQLLDGVLKDAETKSMDNKFFIAGIYGYIGRTYGGLGSMYSAFKYGKKGRNLLEEIIEEDPKYYDAYLGLGMFNYYADRLSGVIKFISAILGFSGDRELGLQYLKLAEEKGNLTKTEACVVLIDIYTNMEQDIESSKPYFQRLVKQFPKNKNYLNWYCNKMTDIDVYTEIKPIIENDSLNLISDFNKGRYYYENGNFKKATHFFSLFLKQYPENPSVHYLNEVSKFLSNKPNSIDEEKLPKNLLHRYTNITQSKKEATIAFNYRANANKGTLYNVHQIPLSLNNTYLKNMTSFYKGVYFYNQNNYQKAIEAFSENSSIQYSKYSSYRYLLSSYMKHDVPVEKAEKLVDMIEDEDFEALEFRIRDLEKKYNL